MLRQGPTGVELAELCFVLAATMSELLFPVSRLCHTLSPEHQQLHFLLAFSHSVPGVISISQMEQPMSRDQWKSESSQSFDLVAFGKLGFSFPFHSGQRKTACFSSPGLSWRMALPSAGLRSGPTLTVILQHRAGGSEGHSPRFHMAGPV